MAYLRRAKGGWRAEVVRRGVRKSATFQTKAAAQAWATREEAAILDGTRGQFPARTFAEALTRYVAEVSSKKRGESTERKRCEALARAYPKLAGKVLHTITPADLAAWRDDRLKRVQPSTVRRDINTFRNLWTIAAKEWGWCAAESPWTSVTIPADSQPRERLMGWREIRALARRLNYRVGCVPLTASENVAWALLVALRTGMRAGEILGLKVGTVDLQSRVATLHQHKTLHVTGRARRVPLTAHGIRLLAPLVAQAKALQREKLWAIGTSSLDTLFRKARDRLMLPDLHFHDSRGTALTSLSRRLDVMTLARISGHRDIRELYQTYYRTPDAEIAAGLARLPRPRSPQRSTSESAG